jgi:hypothetical protein
MDLSNLTPEEVSLTYEKYITDGKCIEENLAIFSNEQLANLLNQLNSLHAASAKQYAKNLENEKKSNQAILVKSIKLGETMKLNNEKHSNYDVVTLNVGGKLFSTFKEILMKLESTYFYALLNSGNFNSGPDGSYFIDRDPAHFGLIMTFLRTGEFPQKKLKSMTSWEIEELEEECDYFLLPSPQELQLNSMWEFDLSPLNNPDNATFSNDNLTITKQSGVNNWNCPVIGTSPESEFTVQIISGFNISIGFCPIDQFVQNGCHWNRATNSCLFGCASGYIYNHPNQPKPYGSGLKLNDKLTVIKNGSSIRFLVNGIDQGEAVNNAPGEMYPFVELCAVGSSVKIVPNPDFSI